MRSPAAMTESAEVVGRPDRRSDLKLKCELRFPDSNGQAGCSLLNGINGLQENALEAREKKSSFQITRVVSRTGFRLDDSDSIDDRNGLDDPSSELGDRSLVTNFVTNVDSEDTVYSSMEDVVAQLSPIHDELKERDGHSRFRLVKIDTQEGVRRGRWHCLDFTDSVLCVRSVDESGPVSNFDKTTCADNEILAQISRDHPTSGFSHFIDDSRVEVRACNGSSLGSAILDVNALVNGISHSPVVLPIDAVSASANVLFSKVESIGEKEFLETFPSFDSSLIATSDFALRLQFVQENLLASRTRKPSETNETEIGEGGASAVAIDNKIEQAMDLVKSHLMFAVREEVEQLKLKIQELSDRNTRLEYENMVLRESAPQETLAKLQDPPSILPS